MMPLARQPLRSHSHSRTRAIAAIARQVLTPAAPEPLCAAVPKRLRPDRPPAPRAGPTRERPYLVDALDGGQSMGDDDAGSALQRREDASSRMSRPRAKASSWA